MLASVFLSVVRAGSNWPVMVVTAARFMALGKTSLLDWLLFTSSLGCTSRASPRAPPSSSLARFASTSLRFMLVWVPEPVCQTIRGNSASCRPHNTSSAAAMMAWALRAGSSPRAWFTLAQADLMRARAWMISMGWRSPEILKCCRERWVWAPHSRAAGTSISPKLSCSIRTVMVASHRETRSKESSFPSQHGKSPDRLLTSARLPWRQSPG
ncbi:hypothetical protein D3C75_830980 [compost metagenome]